MKIINKYIVILILLAFTINSCETTNLDLLSNPDVLTPDSADPNYVLNAMCIDAKDQVRSLSPVSARLVRQINQFGIYTNIVKQESMNSAWSNTYAIIGNLQVIEDISNSKNLPHHVAMGKILKSISMINLVDFMGSAVYTEAVDAEYSNPNFDSGEFIYSEIVNELEDAIVLLKTEATFTPTDLYYGGDINKWEKLANSLILKILVQSRKAANYDKVASVNKINQIINSGKYLTDIEDDFQFKYGTNLTPDNRHPDYTSNYLSGASGYMSNYFLKLLNNTVGNADPRLNHYIYRQTNDAPTGTFITSCTNEGFTTDQCYIGNGYWGRIHADESGIPNDNLLRATYGAYPVGGAFDNSQFLPVNDSSNLEGAGIFPILTSSNINFLLAEAALTLPGINGTAQQYLQKGIENSLNKVSNFTGEPMVNGTQFTSNTVNDYNAATTDDAKLNIIVTQNYIGSFGNGIEPYNAYRRTGYPVFGISFQNPGPFPRSFFLPESEINSNDNPNLTQKQVTDQVFWDTNPAGFIN